MNVFGLHLPLPWKKHHHAEEICETLPTTKFIPKLKKEAVSLKFEALHHVGAFLNMNDLINLSLACKKVKRIVYKTPKIAYLRSLLKIAQYRFGNTPVAEIKACEYFSRGRAGFLKTITSKEEKNFLFAAALQNGHKRLAYDLLDIHFEEECFIGEGSISYYAWRNREIKLAKRLIKKVPPEEIKYYICNTMSRRQSPYKPQFPPEGYMALCIPRVKDIDTYTLNKMIEVGYSPATIKLILDGGAVPNKNTCIEAKDNFELSALISLYIKE